MAGVDHAYQYSVEVKSRFSLFMDESLNNEDPDLLLSKLQNERMERTKKEKAQVLPVAKSEKKVDNGQEKQTSKGQPIAKQSLQTIESNSEIAECQEKASDAPVQQVFRGRGGPRGYGRGFRYGQGNGPRTENREFTQGAGDNVAQRFHPSLPSERRGRFRARGGYYRGRVTNTDVREQPEHPEAAGHDRQVKRNEEPQDTWEGQPDDQQVSATTAATTDEALAPTEHQETDIAEGKEEVKEPPTYTLEEYKAMRSQEKPAVALASKASRKPNDGEDVFANMVVHRKVVEAPEDEYVKVEMEEEEPETIEINLLYNDDRGRRGYGNREFQRGGRGRGRPRTDRGGRGTSRGDARVRGAPRVIYNDQEFPSLK